MSAKGPLDGITVVELGHYIAGPFATQILADHGARVIKVEPKNGEAARGVYPLSEEVSAYYASLNRGKESIDLDLTLPSDFAVLEEILKSADALVSNYRLASLNKLGLSEQRLFEINDNIIFVPISGYGIDGPYSSRPAFDGAIQAASGLMHVTGEPSRKPLRAGIFIPDHASGMHAAFAVLLGILGKRSVGQGQTYDVAMLDVVTSMQLFNFSLVEDFDVSPKRAGNASVNTFSDVFPCADGYVYIAAVSDKMWASLTLAMKRPELADANGGYPTVSDRLANYEELVKAVSAWTMDLTVSQVEERLLEFEVPFAPIATIEEVLTNDQLIHRGKFKKVEYQGKHFTTFGPIIPSKVVLNSHIEDIGESAQKLRDEFTAGLELAERRTK